MSKRIYPLAPGQDDSSDGRLAIGAFLRRSRFRTTGMVIDLRDAHAMSVLRSVIKSHDALGAISIAKAAGLPFMVLAGHLARKRGGVIAIGTEAERLMPAIAAVCERITQVGESMSIWIVPVAEPARSEVEACLAALSTVEGCA
jgi:hypothetical protein